MDTENPDKLITELPLADKIIQVLRFADIRTVKQLKAANLYQISGLSSSVRSAIKKVLANEI